MMTWNQLLAVGVAVLGGSIAIADGVTSFSYQSQPGDYIGQGLTRSYSFDDGTFNIYRTFDNGVEFSFFGDDTSVWWYGFFTAPGDVALTTGSYEGATRWPFQLETEPGLSVYGEGRGCNTLTGRFDVWQVEYDGSGNVLRFAADFEQHCEGMGPAMFGQIRWNATVPEPGSLALLALV